MLQPLLFVVGVAVVVPVGVVVVVLIDCWSAILAAWIEVRFCGESLLS